MFMEKGVENKVKRLANWLIPLSLVVSIIIGFFTWNLYFGIAIFLFFLLIIMYFFSIKYNAYYSYRKWGGQFVKPASESKKLINIFTIVYIILIIVFILLGILK